MPSIGSLQALVFVNKIPNYSAKRFSRHSLIEYDMATKAKERTVIRGLCIMFGAYPNVRYCDCNIIFFFTPAQSLITTDHTISE